jgi:hypothetical protein
VKTIDAGNGELSFIPGTPESKRHEDMFAHERAFDDVNVSVSSDIFMPYSPAETKNDSVMQAPPTVTKPAPPVAKNLPIVTIADEAASLNREGQRVVGKMSGDTRDSDDVREGRGASAQSEMLVLADDGFILKCGDDIR